MANEVKKGTLFVKEVVARIKGDDAEVLGAKIARKAISAVEGQIAALQARLVDAEDAVETAEEKLKDAMFPNVMIEDNKRYCDAIVRAQDILQVRQTELESVQHSIEVFRGILDKF